MKNQLNFLRASLLCLLVALVCLASGCAGTQSSSVESSSSPAQQPTDLETIYQYANYFSDEYNNYLRKHDLLPDEFFDAVFYVDFHLAQTDDLYISAPGAGEWIWIDRQFYCEEHHVGFERFLTRAKVCYPYKILTDDEPKFFGDKTYAYYEGPAWDFKVVSFDGNDNVLSEKVIENVEVSENTILFFYFNSLESVLPLLGELIDKRAIDGESTLARLKYTPCEHCGDDYERTLTEKFDELAKATEEKFGVKLTLPESARN